MIVLERAVVATATPACTVVTGDAMFTQTAIAEHVVQDEHADYLLFVKGNQPTLLEDIEDLHSEAFPPEHTTIEEGHGRIEQRSIWVSSELSGFSKFPHLQQVCRIERVYR